MSADGKAPENSTTSPHADTDAVVHQLPTGQRLNALAGHLNAVHAAIVDVVADALADESWGIDGVRSPQQWLSWQLGITTGEAQRLIALAKARDTHPVVSAMFARGELSLTQATIATSVDASRDIEVSDLVAKCTVNQLKLFTKAMHTSDRDAREHNPQPDRDPVDPSEPDPADRRSTFEFWFGDDGRLAGRFDLDAESGRLLDAALHHSRDLLFHERHSAVDPLAGVRATGSRVTWADALIEIARRSLDADETPARRERFRVNLFVDPAVKPHAEWADRSRVPQCLLDKLTCDGTLTPTFVNNGKPVSVGRSLRIVPDRTRRLVLYRDRHKCRMPWCQRSRWLEVHHVKHWTADHGPTDTDNLISACDTCHDAIHRGDLNVTGNADDPFGLTFTDRHGNPIEYQTPTPATPLGPPPEPAQPYVHPLGEPLDRNNVWIHPAKAS